MTELIVFLIHFSFSIGLFILTNWIGKHSYSVGYMEISIFAKSETAPAFNFLFRVLSPVIYLIIISALLYRFQFDQIVKNIYLVAVYYLVFRILFNVITNRAKLLNWKRQLIHAFTIIVISWMTYDSIIKDKKNILPDFSTISNELWIIILLFIFQILNNLQFKSDDTERRKDSYLDSRYATFRKKYNSLISDLTSNIRLQALVYAVMVYEDFNRPKVARFVENIKFRLSKRPMTLGVMQVHTTELIDDNESVKRGVQKLIKDLVIVQKEEELDLGDNQDYIIAPRLIEKFNGGKSYNNEVTQLYYRIWERYYKEKYPNERLSDKK